MLLNLLLLKEYNISTWVLYFVEIVFHLQRKFKLEIEQSIFKKKIPFLQKSHLQARITTVNPHVQNTVAFFLNHVGRVIAGVNIAQVYKVYSGFEFICYALFLYP